MTRPLEPAIPAHLRVERTAPPRGGHGRTPPYPAYTARFDPQVRRVVMACFGVQRPARGPAGSSTEPGAAAEAALAALGTAQAGRDGAGAVDRAACVDEAGYRNDVLLAYWDDPARYARWSRDTPAWTTAVRAGTGLGFFTEVLRPSVERYQTLVLGHRPEGVARLGTALSDEIAEHGYWGAARDRLPLAQTGDLSAAGRPRPAGQGEVVRVRGQHNICLIRSGQDWTDTEGDERAMYLEDVEPVLRAGMDFLRDGGAAVGCYASRYLRICDASGAPLDKSLGMSWWRSHGHLDAWAATHPTHLDIFGVALRHLGARGSSARLRLHHEVTVAAADEQFFEYAGCHDRTGLLRAGSGPR